MAGGWAAAQGWRLAEPQRAALTDRGLEAFPGALRATGDGCKASTSRKRHTYALSSDA